MFLVFENSNLRIVENFELFSVEARGPEVGPVPISVILVFNNKYFENC
jgi:hypothetical protein